MPLKSKRMSQLQSKTNYERPLGGNQSDTMTVFYNNGDQDSILPELYTYVKFIYPPKKKKENYEDDGKFSLGRLLSRCILAFFLVIASRVGLQCSKRCANQINHSNLNKTLLGLAFLKKENKLNK